MFKAFWLKFRQSFLGEKFRFLVPDYLVNLLKHLPLAVLAVLFYRYPAKSLKVIGVTGTDGKTTTASLIYEILSQAGKKTALISTVSAKIGRQDISTGFHVTSPHPWKLQKLMRQIVNQSFEYLVLEATSHGLVQHRLLGSNFYLGVLTNITHEHLDYHRSFKNYSLAKAKLFKRVKIAILNKDDQSYQFLFKKISGNKKTRIITYALKEKADFTPQVFKFKTCLPGKFNQYNCLAAIATASSLGIPQEKIKKAVASFKRIKGRMEIIDEGQDFKAILDFAHTPNALRNALLTLRDGEKGRLIVVFGCAGQRDMEKRPLMGEIASQYADLVILTSEDPRKEEVDKIIDQIVEGCQKKGGREGKTFLRIPDRREAIRFAIQQAKENDRVIVCGKGYEQSMCFGTREYPWSDEREIRKALKLISGKKK